MFVEDEQVGRTVVVEKRIVSKDSLELLVLVPAGDKPVSNLAADLERLQTEFALAEDKGGGSLEVRIVCPRAGERATDALCRTLLAVFEWLGVSASTTYHVYFHLQKADSEGARHSLEEMIADPTASARQKEVARRALELLDARLEARNAERRKERRRKSRG